MAREQGGAHALLRETLADDGFLNFRPSKIAAAVVYAERRARGVIPFWPSVLAKMTRYEDMTSHELSLAIKARPQSLRAQQIHTMQVPKPLLAQRAGQAGSV